MIYRLFSFLIAILFMGLCLQGPLQAKQQEHETALKAAPNNVERYSAQRQNKGKSSAVCGNAIVDPGEQCDDGNNVNADGCSSACRIERPICGNGLVEAGEQCDDANNANGDGCSRRCQIE